MPGGVVALTVKTDQAAGILRGEVMSQGAGQHFVPA